MIIVNVIDIMYIKKQIFFLKISIQNILRSHLLEQFSKRNKNEITIDQSLF